MHNDLWLFVIIMLVIPAIIVAMDDAKQVRKSK